MTSAVRVWFSVAFALALSSAAVSAPASASVAVTSSGGFKYVTNNFILKGGTKTETAACPKRTHVLSGGHYNSGGFGDVIGAHSYPYDGDDRDRKPDDGWAAKLRGFEESVPAAIHAICARTFPEYPKDTMSVAPGGLTYRSVSCDPPTVQPTGGGSHGGTSVREVSGFVPFENYGWDQGLANHGNRTRTVTLYAICSTLEVQRVIDAGPSAAPGTQTFDQAACPPGAPHVVGGGVGIDGDNPTRSNAAIAATRPGPNLSLWQAWMDNYNSGTAFNVLAIAICSPPL